MKKIINLENLIYFAVFILPLYLIRIRLGFVSANVWELTIGLILIIWLWKKGGTIDPRKFYADYKVYVISAGLIFFGLFVSSFFSFPEGDIARSLGIIKGWFLIPVVFTLLAADIIPREKTKNIFLAYGVSAFFVSLVSLGYLFLGNLTYDGRLQAFFNSPNYLAMYLAPALLIGLEQVQSSKFPVKLRNGASKVQSPGMKLLFLGFLIIISTSLYFTFSYAAWASVILAAIIMLLIQKKISLKTILISADIIILLLIFQLKNPKLQDLANLDSRSSLASRIMIWKASARMIKNHWFIGIGPGNFQETYLGYQKYYPPYLEWAVPHPHNLYLTFWLYGGIVGLIGFFSLIFFWLKDIWGKIKSGADWAALFTLGIMSYILVHGLMDTTYFKNDLAVIFWLCFVVLLKPPKNS